MLRLSEMIAVTRCRVGPDRRAFMAKRMAEGKTRKEAMRSLKRHLSNRIDATMMADANSVKERA
jgi:hypothetical protein